MHCQGRPLNESLAALLIRTSAVGKGEGALYWLDGRERLRQCLVMLTMASHSNEYVHVCEMVQESLSANGHIQKNERTTTAFDRALITNTARQPLYLHYFNLRCRSDTLCS